MRSVGLLIVPFQSVTDNSICKLLSVIKGSLIFVNWNLIREFLSRLDALHPHLTDREIHDKVARETSPIVGGTL